MTGMNVSMAASSAIFARLWSRWYIRLNMVDSMVHFLWMDAPEKRLSEPEAELGQQVARALSR